MITTKEGMHVEDEGVSDCSVEEMPEVYVKKSHHHRRLSGRGRSRVWSRENMLRSYQPHVLPRTSYTSNLYNFAWAQAVQNKPLGFAEADAGTSSEKVPGDDGLTVDGEAKKEAEEEDMVEKEEGELEEGEIDDVEFVGERTGDSSMILDGEKKADDGDADSMTVSVSLPDDLIKMDKVVNDDGNNDNGSIGNMVEDARIDNGGEVVGKAEKDCEEEDTEDLDTLVLSAFEDLEKVSEGDAEKSFEGACFRLQKTMENLPKMVLEGHLPVFDAIIQKAFEGVETIHSVFLRGQEQNKEAYGRFLAFIKRQKLLVFSSDQMKKLDSMIQVLGSEYVDKVEDRMSSLDPKLAISNSKSGEKGSTPFPRLPTLEPLVIPRVQTDFRPLLDPHVNHDEGSLPSPTRESATPCLLPNGMYSGDTAALLQPKTYKQDAYNNDTVLPYVTDAFKAVSSYQQKYNHISHISNNQLPSPTPSEENNEDNGDIHGEVSSSGVANDRIENSSSTSLNMVDTSVYPHQVGYTPGTVVKAPAKSRDPRLRFPSSNTACQTDFNRQPTPSRNEQLKNDPNLSFPTSSTVGPLDFNKQPAPSTNEEMKNGVNVNTDLISRKQKCMDGQTFNGHSIKRQRNESLFSRDLEMPSSRGGWLEVEDNGAMAVENVNSSCSMEIVSQKEKDCIDNNSCAKQDAVTKTNGISVRNNPAEAVNTIPNVSLTSLLKGIAVNPTMLMQLVKKQQRLVPEFQQKSMNSVQDVTNSASTNGPVRVSFSTDSTLKGQEFEYRPVGSTQSTPQSSAMAQNEAVRLRMKPRDPRRVLHSNIIWKTEGLDPEHMRPTGTSPSNTGESNDCTTTKEQGQQTQSSGPPSQPTLPSDITCQLTKKLINVTDMLPTKPTIASIIPQNVLQSVTIKSGGPHASQCSSSLANEMNLTSTSQSSNPWGDVGHLLNGYDEKQKAAFQRERARRIEEQSKMFAARKLCLVLDLDHTLLNSAKFVEVDQFHDEILKKKEEQDREKPQRHLFRFQHMGMWTKLRPGIWNFLEKASKLFELHLYTMGNNLYATEMAKVLDPTGTLFAGRVISKGDDSDPFDGDDKVPKSKDLEGVLGMESAVVIIDDSVRVWPHHKLNLIVVERYTYFPSSRRQFGLLGPSLLEIDHDERPEEGTLASSLAVIERIHQNFFSQPSLENIDVRNILASEQRKILCGCRIVFSRIFPVGEVNPHLHPLWQTAEQFGAVCTNNIDDQVTHVVANSLGTDKVNWALSTGRFVVHPGWVEASALLYRRANEVDFSVKL